MADSIALACSAVTRSRKWCIGPVDGGSADDRLTEASASAETATVLNKNVEAKIAGVAVEGNAVASAADGSYGHGTDW